MINITKEEYRHQLIDQGWTPKKLREEMQEIRDYLLKEVKPNKGRKLKWLHRYLGIWLYLRYKRHLRIMLKY